MSEDIELLADLAARWLARPAEKEIYVGLAEGLARVIGEDAIISVSDYQPRSQVYRPQAIRGLGRFLETMVALVGRHPLELAGDYPPAVKQAMSRGRLARVEGGVVALAGEVIPPAICRQAAPPSRP